jgi:hypothetical protein
MEAISSYEHLIGSSTQFVVIATKDTPANSHYCDHIDGE